MTRHAFDLVVFDCDGVLVDSERLSIRVDVVYLERLGWPMSESEIIERFVGKSDADMRAVIEEHLGGPVPPEIDEEFGRLYRETFDAELTAVDGIVEALDAIVARGLRTCVASSGSHDKIRRNLGLTGLDGYFGERIFSATDVANGKPAPDLFLHAAAALDAEPARCAVVEDSVHGVRAALAAGMTAFAYAGGVTPAAALSAAATGVVTFGDMRELPLLIAAAEGPA
ncbi:MAG TPA: HAD family hydrolase [Candidatus Limnocylindrales bacterium]|nr:HAD family hydrolase [Candidatus Limnocylindrales bacterium]